MGKHFKLILLSLWCVVLYITNLWGWGLFFSLVLPIITIKFDIKYLKLLLPITVAMILFINTTFLYCVVVLLLLYTLRCIINDDKYQSYEISFAALFLCLCCICIMREISIIPAIIAVAFTPIQPIEQRHYKFKRLWNFSSLVLLVLSFLFICKKNDDSSKAYLHHGVWANATNPYQKDSLTSKSSYSYSELVKILNADTISHIDDKTLGQYNELWIVTPTKPFSKKELKSLKKWVLKGGNLIVSSDHTDLFGHARCTNQIAKLFGHKIKYTATYDSHNKQFFGDCWGRKFIFKTGTNIKGVLFPIVSSWLWEEDAYYMESNFFGPLSPSGDDNYGNKVLLGQLSFGLGQVSYIQDSTNFANFCIYQPNTLSLINLLSSHSYTCRVFFLLLILLPLILLFELYSNRYYFIGLIALSLFVLPWNLGKLLDTLQEEDLQYWSGNKFFVMENGCPFASISTAYSLSPLSGKIPLWVDNIDVEKENVIWVDSIAPKNPSWRWIKIEDKHLYCQNSDSVFDSLYTALKTPAFANLNLVSLDYNKLEVWGVFNDAVMNDWWYDSGILENRKRKIELWLSWLRKDVFEDSLHKAEIISRFSNTRHHARLYIENNPSLDLHIPKPIDHNENIYFGNGVAGKLIRRGDSISILGLKQYQENYNAPKVWVIDYLD